MLVWYRCTVCTRELGVYLLQFDQDSALVNVLKMVLKRQSSSEDVFTTFLLVSLHSIIIQSANHCMFINTVSNALVYLH